MKKFKNPSRTEEDPIVKHTQSGFSAGMYMDPDLPASEMPANAVRLAFNTLLYPEYAEVRPGTELHTVLLPPFIIGRTNYEATKVGDLIIKAVGQNFASTDVDSYFWWPATGIRDIITDFINVTTVRVKSSDPQGPTTASNPGKMSAPENAKKLFHNPSGKLFAFFGQEVYYSEWDMAAWTLLPLRSSRLTADLPSPSGSLFDQNQNIVFLINANGVFAIDTRQDPMEFYKINTECPDNTITEVLVSNVNIHGRRYTHSMSRHIGRINQNRFNEIRIQNESGNNNLDFANNSQDYREVWSPDPIGQHIDYYQTLIGNTIAVAPGDLWWWQQIGGGLPPGGFKIAINGSPLTTITGLDFTGVLSFTDIASVIQVGLRAFFPTATCTYLTVPDHFVINAGTTTGCTVSFVENAGLSSIAPRMCMYEANANPLLNGTVVNTSFFVDGDRPIGPITYPLDSRHWTHVPIYASNDLSVATTDSDRLVLLDEVPIAKAYDAYRSPVNGHILITPGGNGEFSRADVGNNITFSNGVVDTLTAFVSVNEMVGTGTLVAVAAQGSAIGNGRVMDAAQVGTLITRTAGGVFNAGDIGRAFFWADGYRSFITGFIDPNNVTADKAAAHVAQGGTIEPTSRYYNDVISDETLDDRAAKFSLYQRYWQPLPSINTGVVVPGFLIIAKSDVDELHYCQIPVNREYLAGYYNQFYQMAPVKDRITAIREFKDRIVIYCANSSYWCATNVSLSAEVAETGEYVAVLSGVNLLDAKIGVLDLGSITRLPDGKEIIITSEPGLRICNGYQFSENLAVDSDGRSYVLSELLKAQQRTAAGYDRNKLGYILFFSDEAI